MIAFDYDKIRRVAGEWSNWAIVLIFALARLTPSVRPYKLSPANL